MIRPAIAIAAVIAGMLLDPATAGAPACADDGSAAPVLIWRELEDVVSTPGWLISDFWSPSGGRFSYPGADAPPAQLHFDLPHDGPWAVWVRARDETDGMRLATATINGRPTYILGGANTCQWVWYLLGCAQGPALDLQLIRIATYSNFDEWFDTLLLTDDLSFIPPGAAPAWGYPAYAPSAGEEPRAAWLWYPAGAGSGSTGFYRTTFELTQAPEAAELQVRAHASYEVYVNERLIARGAGAYEAASFQFADACRPGTNVMAIVAHHMAWLPGLRLTATVTSPEGVALRLCSNPSWRGSDEETIDWREAGFDDSVWPHPLARIGEQEYCGAWPWPPPE